MLRYSFLLEKDYRINFENKFKDIYNYLSIDPLTRVFPDQRALYTFCLGVGLKFDKKVEISEKNDNAIKLTINEEHLAPFYITFMKRCGDDLEKLNSKEFVLNAIKDANEYANGGMNILYDEVIKKHCINYQIINDGVDFTIDVYNFVANIIQSSLIESSKKNKVDLIFTGEDNKTIRTDIMKIQLKQLGNVGPNNKILNSSIYFEDMLGFKVSNIEKIKVNKEDASTFDISLKITSENNKEIKLVILDEEENKILHTYNFKFSKPFSLGL